MPFTRALFSFRQNCSPHSVYVVNVPECPVAAPLQTQENRIQSDDDFLTLGHITVATH
jgi:hypothetical protein